MSEPVTEVRLTAGRRFRLGHHGRREPRRRPTSAAGSEHRFAAAARQRSATRSQDAGLITTRRRGSSPSLEDATPPTVPTASCTTLRSNGFIGANRTGLARCRHLLGGGPAQLAQFGPPAGPVTGNVQHQPGALAGLGHRRQPSQLLQGIKYLTVVADQLVDITVTDDGDDRSFALHIQVDDPADRNPGCPAVARDSRRRRRPRPPAVRACWTHRCGRLFRRDSVRRSGSPTVSAGAPRDSQNPRSRPARPR